MAPTPEIAPRPNRWLWLAVWSIHLAGAITWWWLLPGGFPLGHLRFWTNTALPFLVMAIAVSGMAAALVRPAALVPLAAFLPAAWLTAALSAVVVFPASSLQSVGLILVVIWLLCGSSLGRMWWRNWRNSARPIVLPLVLASAGAAASFVTVLAQRAGPPDTRPLDLAFPEAIEGGDPQPGVVELGEGVGVSPLSGTIKARCAGLDVRMEPLLIFHSRSPDGCWTVFAPLADRPPSHHRLAGWQMDRPGRRIDLSYQADYSSTLRVQSDPAGRLDVTAWARLEQPVWSHLNSWCSCTVTGHRKLSLSFSPCPEALIEVTPFGGRGGAPMRFAYLDAENVFHVVEARKHEKGPFRELAAGTLADTDALTITLHDEGRPACRLVLDDWASQAGRSLSPTAGWGVPENAIAFIRNGDSPRSPCDIWLSLAATSVGRGWDSVGHGPGVYRSRLRLEPGQ